MVTADHPAVLRLERSPDRSQITLLGSILSLRQSILLTIGSMVLSTRPSLYSYYPTYWPCWSSWDPYSRLLDCNLDKGHLPERRPLAASSVLHLSMKVVNITAITFARRMGELRALMAVPPYIVFQRDKVSLRLHPKFTPQVPSDFHLDQTVHFLFFHPKSHVSKDDRRF